MKLESELKNASEMLKLYEPQVDERLPKAKAGDRSASLNLLAVAAGLMKAGYPMPEKLAEWISLGLAGLSAGLTPEESFGFAGRKRGERTAHTKVRVSNDRFRWAFLVEYLSRTKGISIEKSCAAVALAESVSCETVNLAWDAEKYRARRTLQVSFGEVYWAREIK